MSAPSGRLDEEDAAELLRSLARGGASGRLTLTKRDGHAILAFRSGRIIYAASSSMRESFGHILVLRGLITENDLLAALRAQHRSVPPKRLGQVLIDMGKVEEKALREVMRQQTEDVLRELLRWKTGFFQFEPVAFVPGGEVEVDVKDFVLTEGFSPQEMLGDTAPSSAAGGPAPAPVAPEPPPFAPGAFKTGTFTTGPHSLAKIRAAAGLGDSHLALAKAPTLAAESLPHSPAPAVTAEVTLHLMRYAAQILSRAVLFVVRAEEMRGIGQFGVQVGGRSAPDRVREIVLPLGEPSALADAVEKRGSWRGSLEDTAWNRHLVQRLGGTEPTEAVVVPMIVGGAVALVFYGDNVPDLRPIGPVDTLEFMVAEAALAMERALLEDRERTLRDRRKGDSA